MLGAVLFRGDLEILPAHLASVTFFDKMLADRKTKGQADQGHGRAVDAGNQHRFVAKLIAFGIVRIELDHGDAAGHQGLPGLRVRERQTKYEQGQY